MRLIVQLQECAEEKGLIEKWSNEGRLSFEQKLAIHNATLAHTGNCADTIRGTLCDTFNVSVVEGMNYLVIDVPEEQRIEIEDHIRSACADVLSIVSDFGIGAPDWEIDPPNPS